MGEKIKIGEKVRSDELFWDIGLELLSRGRSIRFPAPGKSMGPFIRDQDIVLIKPCKFEDVRFGDVILYNFLEGESKNRPHSGKIVHRYLGKKRINGREVLITKGDANPGDGHLILPGQVLGKVIAIERNGRKIRLDTPGGRLLNILFALTSPFSNPIRRILKPLR